MPENDSFWNLYWEVRLQRMENLGKRAAILAASRLIRDLARQTGQPVRLLELGCGEGQVIGTLVDAHSQVCPSHTSVGIDYNAQSLAQCHRDYPDLRLVKGDFTDLALLDSLGKFDVVLFVNALHEVFSAGYSPVLGEIDVPAAKKLVKNALTGVVRCLAPGGWLVLFDGLEPAEDSRTMLRIRFNDLQYWNEFQTFAQEYYPFRISYHQTGIPLCIDLTRRNFTRYITKSIFLGKPLWQTERFESYQYFTEQEFQSAIASMGLKISEFSTLTVNEEKWRGFVEILTPGVQFPEEHSLILAQME